MKKTSKLLAIVLGCVITLTSFADVRINGYQRQDGTYVEPHYRSSPNSNVNDNWSTKGNSNPYTGKQGTHETRDYR